MAYYFIYPEKDATIYSHPNRVGLNTGRDEILELLEEKSSVGETYFPSRFLIKFKSTEIKDVLENKLSGISTWQSNLEIFSAEHKSLHTDHIIEVHAISDIWDEGTGRFRNNPTSSNGVTWKMRTDTGSAASAIWATSSFATGVTGSSHNFTNISGGGSWYVNGNQFMAENSFFNEDNLDLNFDVTTIVKYFSASFYQSATYPTGIKNEGFIIKKPKTTEDNPSASFGELQYFSTDTHTIYPPKLTFKWDDSVYSHSGTTLSSGDIFLSLYNNKGEFQRKSKQRFRLTTRKKYPERTFVTSSNYLDTQYLPQSSYYSIRDAETDEVIIPFDTSYTKLSADSEGMYFDLFMEGLQPERYYKLMFRSDNNDGIQIFDEDYYFKVIR